MLSDIDLSLKGDEEWIVIQGDMEGILPEEIEVKAGDGIVEVVGIHTDRTCLGANGANL